MRNRWIAPVLIAGMVAFALAVFPRLPDPLPTHWNFRGEVDGWTPKLPGAFWAPFAAVVTAALLWVLPRIDPRRANIEKFRGELRLVTNLLVLFFALMEVLTLGYALGWPVDVSSGILASVGLLFVGLGNYLPRFRSNWWMGIRTPWTLESERVWRETHRVGGRTFVAGGAVAALAALLLPDPVRTWVAMAALGTASLIPVVYSYLVWRREGSGRAA
jgi:immunity protein, SdpI family